MLRLIGVLLLVAWLAQVLIVLATLSILVVDAWRTRSAVDRLIRECGGIPPRKHPSGAGERRLLPPSSTNPGGHG